VYAENVVVNIILKLVHQLQVSVFELLPNAAALPLVIRWFRMSHWCVVAEHAISEDLLPVF
jgi:hypothetical protein